MAKKKVNIEDLFRDEFSGFTMKPDEQVWKNIRKKLVWKDFFSFKWNKFNIVYSGLFLSAIIASLILIMKTSSPEITEVDSSQLYNSDYSEDTNNTGNIISESYTASHFTTNNDPQNRTSILTESADNQTIITKELNTQEPEAGIQKVSPTGDQENESILMNTGIELPSGLMALFVCSENSGCVPLSVNFSNLSTDAKEYSWSFGDGGFSEIKNPQYIFDEPGEYIVNLTVNNESNEISTFSQVIKVYDLPRADFQLDIQDLGDGGIPVHFYNYSRGASEYYWNFGDGGSSEESDPSWIYDQAGKYNIKLLVKNAYGCQDSMTLENIFDEGSPEIVMPNAFSPNTNGPGGGYYNQTDNNNDVFHPWFEENPVEYQLKIFNRKGNLLFESQDINIGWDGYFNQSLQPQGVYIYKVRVKFQNGQTVVKMGDLTLFHKD